MNGKPDWSRGAQVAPDELDRLLEEDWDEVDDGPELREDELARLRPGAEAAPALAALAKRRPGQRGPGRKPPKELVTLRVDQAALEAFKATGPRWRSRMNEVLQDAARKLRTG